MAIWSTQPRARLLAAELRAAKRHLSARCKLMWGMATTMLRWTFSNLERLARWAAVAVMLGLVGVVIAWQFRTAPPTTGRPMFHYWARGERGWGYFRYPYATDAGGSALFVDEQLNLLVLVVADDPGFHRFGSPGPHAWPTHVVIYPNRPHSVRLDAMTDRLVVVVPGAQLGQLTLSSDCAREWADDVFNASFDSLNEYILRAGPTGVTSEIGRILAIHGIDVSARS